MPAELKIDGHTLSQAERRVVHAALLAQVDDVHTGGVYSWGDEEVLTAQHVLASLSGTPVGEAPDSYGSSLESAVVVKSLIVPLYDLDHPDLSGAEWETAERLLAQLSKEFGR